MNESNENPARKLGLPKIRHIGIVVENIDRTIRYYSDTFRIQPWFKTKFTGGENYLRGVDKINTEYATASAFSGKVEYQLIQVTGGERDVCLDYLEKHGEGVHHFGVYVRDLDRRLRMYKEMGVGVLQSGILKSGGKAGGAVSKYAYLDTAGIGGIVFELIQIDLLGIGISSSRFWFELGGITGYLEKCTYQNLRGVESGVDFLQKGRM